MSNFPGFLRNKPYQSVSDDLNAATGAGVPPLLSIEGDRFTLKNPGAAPEGLDTADKGVPYADVVVIHALPYYAKIFYGVKYDPTKPAPPICFSTNGTAPSRNAREPQSSTCKGCDHDAWGTGDEGKGKACRDYAHLAVLVVGYEGIYLLRVPPVGLTNLRKYNGLFQGKEFGIDDVVTRVSFDRSPGARRGTLTFSGIDFIKDKNIAEARNAARLSKITDNLIGLNDVPIAGALPVPQQRAALVENQMASLPPFESAPTAALPTSAPTTPLPAPEQAPSSAPRRGRPRKHVETSSTEAPFPTGNGGSEGFGISQGSAPGAQINKALDDFFGPAK
jgi:hypothetical protein